MKSEGVKVSLKFSIHDLAISLIVISKILCRKVDILRYFKFVMDNAFNFSIRNSMRLHKIGAPHLYHNREIYRAR
ncbi:hypothetical protein RIR_jg27134.t1 [Rhizophagus irregularis DAOM 181602=DAOM 197198]|nr:hypothetical protein RIR_jg27134.t1 [Rhizophagus irregularis DAOM 181602=DAOM 197198]